MKTRTDEYVTEDEFEPIELGTVSEETRGLPGIQDEFGSGSANSRVQ
ncbi:hypothetical protein [Henriciella sp.]|jgi:hypothetical protein|nr:hypothetical protein [Henriciella sp.]|tara:strand:+ start:814 stop:954 length:141 start_codon:yes stop_codon:yes gene_type:complete